MFGLKYYSFTTINPPKRQTSTSVLRININRLKYEKLKERSPKRIQGDLQRFLGAKSKFY